MVGTGVIGVKFGDAEGSFFLYSGKTTALRTKEYFQKQLTSLNNFYLQKTFNNAQQKKCLLN